jgi:phosphate transport system substrate-binding protein
MDRPVIVVGLGEGRALRDVVIDQFSLRPGQLRPDPTVGSSELVMQTVAHQPAAIGYVSLAVAEVSAHKEHVKRLPFQDVPATQENVGNRSYTLSRHLLLLTREPPTGVVGEFHDFVLTEEAREVILKHGLVPATQ